MPDHGRTPITGRLGVSESEGITHFTTDVVVRRATFGVIPLMLGGGLEYLVVPPYNFIRSWLP